MARFPNNAQELSPFFNSLDVNGSQKQFGIAVFSFFTTDINRYHQ